MNDVIITLIQTYPWLPGVMIGATLLAAGIRAAYPDSIDRPKWVVVVLAIIDVLQGNLSGPVKLMVKGKT